MTQVDFYVLEKPGLEPHDRMICRIVEKAWQQGHGVYVRCRDAEAARAFDEFLWQFRDVSFVPHALEGQDEVVTVAIGTGEGPARDHDVLVNLGGDVPASASSFERVVESAGHDDSSRADARERYRYYQERGFPLRTHKVSR